MNEAGTLAMRVCRLVICALLAACGEGARESAPEPTVLVLGTDTVFLESGARVADIRLAAEPGGAEFEPAVVEAMPGDVLRFSAHDGGPHALVFDDRLTGVEALAFLAATGQLRGLPLLERGAAWVVSLAEAPPGRYVVRCLTHGGEIRIQLGPTGRHP